MTIPVPGTEGHAEVFEALPQKKLGWKRGCGREVEPVNTFMNDEVKSRQ